MGPSQAPGAGFMHMTAGSLVWDEFLIHIKQWRDGGGVGLRLPPFSKYIQQLNGSWCMGGLYIEEDAWLGWNIQGESQHHCFGHSIDQQKYN
jgi:hypothetical protein